MAMAQLEIISPHESTNKVIDLNPNSLLDILFTDLDDTPGGYDGSAGECVVVNTAGNALEFEDCSNATGSVNSSEYWDDLDTPADIDHNLLNNREWSVAGHIIDVDIDMDDNNLDNIDKAYFGTGAFISSDDSNHIDFHADSMDFHGNMSTIWNIILTDSDGSSLHNNLMFGGQHDAWLYYNGSDFIIDPDVVGDGDVVILGDARADNFVGNGSQLTDIIGTLYYADEDWINKNSTNAFIFNESKLATIYYNATQSLAVTGTIDGGVLSDTHHADGSYDGVTFNFSEESGSPGLDLRMNFTDIETFNAGVMRYKTSSLAGDYPVIQLWSYDDSIWEDYPTVAESESFATITQPAFDSTEHVSGEIVQMRIYKASNGNTQNHYYVDWITISKGYGTPAGEEVDPLSVHKTGGTMTGDLDMVNNLILFNASIDYLNNSGGLWWYNAAANFNASIRRLTSAGPEVQTDGLYIKDSRAIHLDALLIDITGMLGLADDQIIGFGDGPIGDNPDVAFYYNSTDERLVMEKKFGGVFHEFFVDANGSFNGSVTADEFCNATTCYSLVDFLLDTNRSDAEILSVSSVYNETDWVLAQSYLNKTYADTIYHPLEDQRVGTTDDVIFNDATVNGELLIENSAPYILFEDTDFLAGDTILKSGSYMGPDVTITLPSGSSTTLAGWSLPANMFTGNTLGMGQDFVHVGNTETKMVYGTDSISFGIKRDEMFKMYYVDAIGPLINIFNDGGKDVDTIVESANDHSLFFLNGGTDKIGISDSSPAALLDVGGGTATSIDGTDDLIVADDLEVDGDLYVEGNGQVDGNFTVNSSKSFLWSSSISVTMNGTSGSSNAMRSIFDEDSYNTFIPHNNSVPKGIIWDTTTGNFTIENAGLYYIDLRAIYNIASTDEVRTTIYKNDEVIWSWTVTVHSAVDPAPNPPALMQDVEAGDKIGFYAGPDDGVDTMQFIKGTTLNIFRIS